MAKRFYLGFLLAALAVWPVLASAQKDASSGARVQHLVVRGTADKLEVEIQTSGPAVTPNTQAITGPDRIVVDFPRALPSDELRALKVNRGPLKGVRSGLFFNNPAITRVVLDLTGPQKYTISTAGNTVVVKLGSGDSLGNSEVAREVPHQARVVEAVASVQRTPVSSARIQTAALPAPAGHQTTAETESPQQAAVSEATPPKPPLTVTFENGMLSIHAEKATLAQVLFEVHQQTQAEIAIPAGAEQEEVVVDLGPGTSRDVLASLLNGSPYNFIFVGSETHLEQVVLSRRDNNPF